MAELSVNDIIRISTSIAPQGLVRRETGRTLLLTQDNVIPTYERVKTYTSLAGVAEDFESTSDVYLAAQVYFSQDPYPRNLLVGRHNEATTPASLYGSSVDVETDIATWKAIPDGEFDITVDGLAGSYSASSFIGVTDMDDVVFAIGLTLVGIANVSWDGERIIFTSVSTGATATIGYTSALVAPAGTDISSMMGTEATDDGVVIENGSAVETIADALSAIIDIEPSFTFVCEASSMSDTDAVGEIAAWCLANRSYIACSASSESNVLTGTAETHYNDLFVSQNGNAFGTWSETVDYKHLSAAARLSSVNFSQANSLITLNMKQMPTCTPDGLTTTQVGKLDDQLVNRYVTRSTVPMYETGHTFDSDWWVDTKYWTIWFENACLTAIFNLLYSSGKIPQTEVGMSMLKSVLEGVCEEGVRNGGIAGGTLSPALANDVRQTTLNDSFDGTLPRGYFIYSEPMALQSTSDRGERKATPIKIWLKGSGAIQEVDIAVVFEQ